uniref:Uncharacterized protein LOC111111582 isoform X3 n=1 Tax=Crassostrea virginica TaxID=6565 RepID=A0A8B8BNB6_CRAVI|nr:uncharacterized protein LOC111111582 isoform X3 [Crassostrea virginica]
MSTTRLLDFVAALGFVLIGCIVYTHINTKDCLEFKSISLLERAVIWIANAVIFGIVLLVSYKTLSDVWNQHRYQEENNELKTKIERYQEENNELKTEIERLQEQIKGNDEPTPTKNEEESEERKEFRKDLNNALRNLRPAGVPDIEIPRPHKLKEEFADLHEKEWTSALKSLQKTTKSEDMSIRMLLQTLRDIYSSCCNYSNDEKEEAMQSLLMRITGDNVAKKKLNEQQMMAEVCKQQNRSTARAIEEIRESVFDKNPELVIDHLWKKYVERSVKICRLMSIQSKPMLLDFGPEQNADLNPSIFTTYKATGSKVNFVVWPAMFMQENRELLSKGIVEPIERNIH